MSKLYTILWSLHIMIISAQFFPTVAKAQEKKFYYTHYSVDNGLIYNEVLDVHLDHDGFIWLATAMGLQCIESYSTKEYYNNANDSLSISDNIITALFEDDKGNMWIGTAMRGVNMYDKELQMFHRHSYNQGNPKTLSSNEIPRGLKVFAQDKDGFIWVNTGDCLNKIDPGTGIVERIYGEFSGHIIYDKRENCLWIGESVLKRLDINTRHIDLYTFPDLLKDPIHTINAMLLDNDGMIWLGTDLGVFLFDIHNKIFYGLEEYLAQKGFDASYTWSQQAANAIYQDIGGQMWVAVEKTIYILNLNTGKFLTLSHEVDNQNSILNESIGGIYGSHNGVVLISYIRSGITKIDIGTQEFRYIGINRQKYGDQNSFGVRAIYKDHHNNLWVGTYNHGLHFLPDQDPGRSTQYEHEMLNDHSPNSNYITAIYIDRDERLWIGTYNDGYCFADNIYKSGQLNFTRSKFNRKVEVHEFTEDKNGRIWISTDEGFYVYDKKNGKVRQYGWSDDHDQRVREVNIQSVYIEDPNIFWLATWNRGVGKLIINSDSLLTEKTSKDTLIIYNNPQEVISDGFYTGYITIAHDQNDNFWLGSNVNGLIKMNVRHDSVVFKTYGKPAGAPSNAIYGIQEDKDGNIWISSSYGIAKFNPLEERFYNYYESNGLQGNSFSWDAQFQAEDGELFFGGDNGISAFYPEKIKEKRARVKAYLSKLFINHEEVENGKKVNNRNILDKSIRFTDKITLTNKESVLAIEFGVLNYPSPKDIIYAYTLEGYDEQWINATYAKRTATYTNLNKGTYYFKVKASTQDGEWGDPATLMITILPPWWKTTWAYISYLLIFLLLIYLLKQQLEKRAELKHNLELEQHMHERDKELSRQKFNFFTNLSHEFRTPLTLILGPLEKMISKNEGSNRIQQKHLLIHRQAQKLLKLTNQLLNFRKIEAENLKLNATEGDMINFLDEVMIAFRNQARLKEIHFHFLSSEKAVQMWYDSDKMEIILSNLLSNAFKYTPSGGTIQFNADLTTFGKISKLKDECDKNKSVCYGELPDKVEHIFQMVIKDSGYGIAPDRLQHIFKHYYQAANMDASPIEGSGIGLEITKNFVELHHGCIMAHSELGEGTTFYLWFPMGQEHLRSDEIISDFKPSDHPDHYLIPDLLNHEPLVPEEDQIKDDKDRNEILIIDDNPDILLYLKSIFQEYYNVDLASNGTEGLEKAFSILPDLIISDIMMPEMDGFELCSKIKSDVNTSHIPVILLTARSSNLFRTEGLETGADDYVTKPFNEKVLYLKVKNLINSRNILRKKYAKEITLKPKDITINNSDENFLNDLINIIEEHIADNDFKIEDFARQLGMSHSGIYKKTKYLTDLSLVEFIRTIKLKKAREYLLKTDLTISQVSYEVGFSDPKYFSKCFQKYFGKSPSQYFSENKIKIT